MNDSAFSAVTVDAGDAAIGVNFDVVPRTSCLLFDVVDDDVRICCVCII